MARKRKIKVKIDPIWKIERGVLVTPKGGSHQSKREYNRQLAKNDLKKSLQKGDF